MSTTLTNGYILPQTGDLGTIWFAALESNIQRLNDHNHDGTNSNKLTALSFTLLVDNLVMGDFSVVGDEYRATVTVPAGISVDETTIKFRDPTTKDPMYLKVEKISLTQFYVYALEAVDAEVIYG